MPTDDFSAKNQGAVCPLAAARLTPEDIFEQMKAGQGVRV
jgi:hypothetical protein